MHYWGFRIAQSRSASLPLGDVRFVQNSSFKSQVSNLEKKRKQLKLSNQPLQIRLTRASNIRRMHVLMLIYMFTKETFPGYYSDPKHRLNSLNPDFYYAKRQRFTPNSRQLHNLGLWRTKAPAFKVYIHTTIQCKVYIHTRRVCHAAAHICQKRGKSKESTGTLTSNLPTSASAAPQVFIPKSRPKNLRKRYNSNFDVQLGFIFLDDIRVPSFKHGIVVIIIYDHHRSPAGHKASAQRARQIKRH